jgi:hypothetical protein
VFKNRVVRKICGPKRDELKGDCTEGRLEELHNLYSWPNIRVITSRRTRWVGHVARTRERTGAYRVLVGKYGGRRPLGRRRREDNIRMDSEEIVWKGAAWIDVVQGRNKWRAVLITAQ